MKKIIAILTVFALLLTIAACNGKKTEEETETATDSQGEALTDSDGNYMTEVVTKETDTSQDSSAQTMQQETIVLSADPSEWTKEEIVGFYKAAAIRSTGQKSKQTMTMEEMVVNGGEGFIGTMVELATPIMKSALSKNSTEFDGITGGYENIAVTDIETAKAYKSGRYTVVEMTMKEQTDGIHGDMFSGTVGHSISVVGDISNVAEALPEFVIDFDNAELSLHYADPKLRVKINDKGIIEKGTWTYTVNVNVADLYIAAVKFPIAVTIDSAHGRVGYVITTGGGF